MTIIEVIIRLVLASIMGGVIGIERETRKSTAGLRTFSLVCLGSALTMIINEYLISVQSYSSDPTRLSAQVISGIGFLGMGCIIVTSRNQVRGLTTAATLWSTAILGLAVGAGMIATATIALIIIMIVVHWFSHASRTVESYTRIITLYVEVKNSDGIHEIMETLNSNNYDIVSMEKMKMNFIMEKTMAIQMDIDLKERKKHSEIVNQIMELNEVEYVEEVK